MRITKHVSKVGEQGLRQSKEGPKNASVYPCIMLNFYASAFKGESRLHVPSVRDCAKPRSACGVEEVVPCQCKKRKHQQRVVDLVLPQIMDSIKHQKIFQSLQRMLGWPSVACLLEHINEARQKQCSIQQAWCILA